MESLIGKKVRIKNHAIGYAASMRGEVVKIIEEDDNVAIYLHPIYGKSNLMKENHSYLRKEFDIMEEENRKIIGYRLLKDLPEVNAGVEITSKIEDKWSYTSERSTYDFYDDEMTSDFFSPIYEEEFKVGDYVLLSNNAGGWGELPENSNNKIVCITKIDLNDRGDCGGKIYWNDGKERQSVYNEIVRKVTPEEIKQSQQIKFGQYVVEFKKDFVTIGCGNYYKEGLEAARHVLNLKNVVAIEFIKGVKVTLENVNKVLNKLNNK